MRYVSDKIWEKIKTHVLWSVTFFSGNLVVYEIMWGYMAEPDGSYMTIRHMCFACRKTKARIHTLIIFKTISSYIIDSVWSRKMLCGKAMPAAITGTGIPNTRRVVQSHLLSMTGTSKYTKGVCSEVLRRWIFILSRLLRDGDKTKSSYCSAGKRACVVVILLC